MKVDLGTAVGIGIVAVITLPVAMMAIGDFRAERKDERSRKEFQALRERYRAVGRDGAAEFAARSENAEILERLVAHIFSERGLSIIRGADEVALWRVEDRKNVRSYFNAGGYDYIREKGNGPILLGPRDVDRLRESVRVAIQYVFSCDCLPEPDVMFVCSRGGERVVLTIDSRTNYLIAMVYDASGSRVHQGRGISTRKLCRAGAWGSSRRKWPAIGRGGGLLPRRRRLIRAGGRRRC